MSANCSKVLKIFIMFLQKMFWQYVSDWLPQFCTLLGIYGIKNVFKNFILQN